MKTSWTKGITGEKRLEIEREFNASALLRERLMVILEEKLNTKRAQKVSEEIYANPSWPYMQADAVGYERAIREVISLLTSVKV